MSWPIHIDPPIDKDRLLPTLAVLLSISLPFAVNELFEFYCKQLFDAGLAAYNRTALDAAKSNWRQVLNVRRLVNRVDEQYAYTEDWLGNLYEDQGKYKDAESLFRHAVLLGETQPAAGLRADTYLDDLASSYQHEARFAEAKALYKRAMADRLHSYSKNSSQVAVSLQNIGCLYLETGRYAEAETLLTDAYRIRRRELGPTNFWTIRSMKDLAIAYGYQDHNDKALPLFRDALRLTRATSGEESLSFAYQCSNLAVVYTQFHRYGEAEPLLDRAVAITTKLYGRDSLPAAECLRSLGVLYINMERLPEAASAFDRVLAVRLRLLGPAHPDTASAQYSVARVYQHRGDQIHALPLLQQALPVLQRSLGSRDKFTRCCAKHLEEARKFVDAGNRSATQL